MPLATKTVFTSNPLMIILLISSVPEMLFWCNFCLAGSNLFETNNFIEFGFFLVWGDPSTSWTRSQRICTKKHVGISTVKCGWHLAFVSTLFEDHRRGPWQILTVEACLPCLKKHFASSQHPIAAATPAIRPLLWAGYAWQPRQGTKTHDDSCNKCNPSRCRMAAACATANLNSQPDSL